MSNSGKLTIDRIFTPSNNTIGSHSSSTLTRRVASLAESDKTVVSPQLHHYGAYAAYERALQTIEAADAVSPGNIDAVLSIESLYTTGKGVRGYRVLVLTQSGTIELLPVVTLGALVCKERIARQTRYTLGEYAYEKALLWQESRIRLPCPIHAGRPPEEILDEPDMRKVKAGEELPLKHCSPLLEALVRSILDL